MQSKLKLPLISNFMRLGLSGSGLILELSSVYVNKGAFNCTLCLKLLLSGSSACTQPELLLTSYNSFLWYLIVVICLHHVLEILQWGEENEPIFLCLCVSQVFTMQPLKVTGVGVRTVWCPLTLDGRQVSRATALVWTRTVLHSMVWREDGPTKSAPILCYTSVRSKKRVSAVSREDVFSFWWNSLEGHVTHSCMDWGESYNQIMILIICSYVYVMFGCIHIYPN